MLTEEQKREFERMFNYYSLQKSCDFNDDESRVEWDIKMMAFRIAVSILGYEFVFDSIKEEPNGVKWYSSKLEKIRE